MHFPPMISEFIHVMERSTSKRTVGASWDIAPELGFLDRMREGIVFLECRKLSERSSARGVVTYDISVEADGAYHSVDFEVGTGLWA
jgi:hypothetical protein